MIKEIPFPLAKLKNKRSFISKDNLIDFIVCCMEHPQAANEVFLVSDDYDLSTPELLEQLAKGMGRSLRLLPVPVILLRIGCLLAKRSVMYQKLCGSLQVDISKAKKILNWTPSKNTQKELQKAAQDYYKKQVVDH